MNCNMTLQINTFAHCSNKNVQKCTRNVLGSIMSNELSTRYNWAGHGKLAFKQLRVAAAVGGKLN